MQPLQERHLSASALATYQVCPLRFRYRYLDNLYWTRLWSAPPEERAALERGQNFHLMARRYYMGLDPAQVADPVEQRELDHWLSLLQGFLPRTFDRAFYPELELRLNRPELRLVAKFDLVTVDPDGKAMIFDWKTEKRLPDKTYLVKAMQTVVYRYMLCAAGGQYSPRGRFRPDEVTMVYWNPMHAHRWHRLQYTEAQFEKDEQFLQNTVAQILRSPREMFLATTNESACRRCEFQMICHGRRAEQLDLDDEESLVEATLSWDDLLELP